MAAPTGLGINFAHDGDCYNDNAICIQQLTILKDLGITKIRVNIPTYLTEAENASFRDKLRTVCTTALGMGFYVIWGYKAFPLTAANTAAFKTALRSCGEWAESVGLSEICVGNEEDLNSTLSAADLRAALQDVCQTIKVTDEFSGVVSTAITTNVYAAWETEVATWSPYMKLDLHIYGGLAVTLFDDFVADAVTTLGSNVYCGEWGVDGAEGAGRNAFSSDQAWVKEIIRRMTVMEAAGMDSFYYFAYAVGGADETKWSAYRGTDAMPTELLRRMGRKRQHVVSTS